MKIAIVGDTHWGVRNESRPFLRQAEEWARSFFDYLRENDIKTIFHLGDLVDRRKYINFYVARSIRQHWIRQIIKDGITSYYIAGNHDVYYTNTNEINALREILPHWRDDFIVFDHEPGLIEIDNIWFSMIPWISESNQQLVADHVQNTKASYACAHLELKGFDFYRGQKAEHGLDHRVFSRYNQVWTGHYHTQSKRDNIHYVGAPFEMVWSDYDDPRGFWVFDTSDHSMTFVQNEERMFLKVHVTDKNYEYRDGQYTDKVVKLIVPSAADPIEVERLMSALESENASDIQVVDDHLNMDLLDEVEISDQVGDTLNLLKDCVSALPEEVDKDALTRLMVELYNEAQTTRG